MNIAKLISFLPRFLRRHKIVQIILLLSPQSRTQLIMINGNFKLFLDVSDPYARSYLFVGGYDPEFFSIAKPFLSRGGVFFDVGANFGFCSFGLIGCLSRNDIEFHLFEANAEICKLLFQSAALYPDCTVSINHCCVTDSPGTSSLYINSNNFGSSFISEYGTQDVHNLILDTYIYERSIRKINLLKIDIEGWEPRALKGALNSLATGIIDTIYIEISTLNLSRVGSRVDDCFALLKDAGFVLFYVKNADFESGLADEGKALALNINGYPLKAATLDSFPVEHQTDILAIHKSSEFLWN